MTSDLPLKKNQKSPIESYLHVLHALMLRDTRTRFGGSHYGYVVTVLWPVAHVFMLVIIYTVRGIPAPYGESRPIFFASGAVPALLFQYIAREIMKSILTNRPLTYYPQVKLVDLIFSRVIVEIITGFLALIVVFALLFAFGINPIPADPFTAMCGYLAAILLGIGIGIINVSIVAYFPGWIVGFMLCTIIIYITSGVMFMPNFMPDQIYLVLKYNPVVQIIEWVRLGYYPELPVTIDYIYVIMFSFSCITIGLLLEKHVVRKIN